MPSDPKSVDVAFGGSGGMALEPHRVWEGGGACGCDEFEGSD